MLLINNCFPPFNEGSVSNLEVIPTEAICFFDDNESFGLHGVCCLSLIYMKSKFKCLHGLIKSEVLDT